MPLRYSRTGAPLYHCYHRALHIAYIMQLCTEVLLTSHHATLMALCGVPAVY